MNGVEGSIAALNAAITVLGEEGNGLAACSRNGGFALVVVGSERAVRVIGDTMPTVVHILREVLEEVENGSVEALTAAIEERADRIAEALVRARGDS